MADPSVASKRRRTSTRAAGCLCSERRHPSATYGNVFVMAHASYLREKARSMRVERQLTIDELAERLALSRSTIYYWVRDLPIPGSGSGGEWPEAARRKGNVAMQRKYGCCARRPMKRGAGNTRHLRTTPRFAISYACISLRGTSGIGTSSRFATRIRRSSGWRLGGCVGYLRSRPSSGSNTTLTRI
jgi:excisionase family DNA binding protein